MISITICIHLSFYAQSLIKHFNLKKKCTQPLLTSTMTSDVFRGDDTAVSGHSNVHNLPDEVIALTIPFSLQDMIIINIFIVFWLLVFCR